jgi:hypothetical protein
MRCVGLTIRYEMLRRSLSGRCVAAARLLLKRLRRNNPTGGTSMITRRARAATLELAEA